MSEGDQTGRLTAADNLQEVQLRFREATSVAVQRRAHRLSYYRSRRSPLARRPNSGSVRPMPPRGVRQRAGCRSILATDTNNGLTPEDDARMDQLLNRQRCRPAARRHAVGDSQVDVSAPLTFYQGRAADADSRA